MNILGEFLQNMNFLSTASITYAKIVAIVLGCLFLYKITNIIFKIITKHLSEKHWVFNGLLYAVNRPLRVFFMLLGCVMIAQELVITFGFDKIKFIFEFEIVSLVFCIAWAAIRFVAAIKKHVLEFDSDYEDKTLVLAFSQIVTIIIATIALLITLHTFEVNIAGILALGGIGGIAVGFAAKDLLSNFFGALMIYLDKPFQVGDWIRSPEKEIEGVVESIGWRQVKILTFETRPIYVPNSLFSSIVIENASRMTHRRFNERIYIRYEDLALAEGIIQDIKYMLNLNTKVDNNKDIIVNIVNFEECITIVLICYVTHITAATFHMARHEIFTECGNIVEKHGAKLTFPAIKSIKK